MNPLVVETLVRMQQQEVLREIEQDRLLKALPWRQPASLTQVLRWIFLALKIRALKTSVSNTARKAGAAEC
jgi:hypothetical protein